MLPPVAPVPAPVLLLVNQPITATYEGPGAAMTAAVPDGSAELARAGGRMLVIIPAFNEEGRVQHVIADVKHWLPRAGVLVVDDGSSDATGEEALAAGAKLLRLPVNSATAQPCRRATSTPSAAATRNRQIDADGQHRAEHFVTLLAHLTQHEVDVVIGSRFLDRDGHYQAARARKVGMALFGSIASAVTRQHVSDPTSGFQVMRLSVAQFFCTDVYPTDYPDADILILLHRSGFRIGEVGVQMRLPPSKSMHSGPPQPLLRLQDVAVDPRDDATPRRRRESLMPIETRIIAVGASLGILALVVELVRRRRLKEEYSVLWVLTALVLLVLSLWYALLLKITTLIGAVLPSSTLFFFGLVFALLMLLHFSVRVSSMERR